MILSSNKETDDSSADRKDSTRLFLRQFHEKKQRFIYKIISSPSLWQASWASRSFQEGRPRGRHRARPHRLCAFRAPLWLLAFLSIQLYFSSNWPSSLRRKGMRKRRKRQKMDSIGTVLGSRGLSLGSRRLLFSSISTRRRIRRSRSDYSFDGVAILRLHSRESAVALRTTAGSTLPLTQAI